MSKIRQQRTAEQMQQLLSEIFLREMNDPRLQDVTVTEVTIDRELEHADVYVNALGDESRQPEVMSALSKATGYLRHEVAGRMSLRKAPHLHFHWDPRLRHFQEVEDILDTLEIPPADDDAPQSP
ncbi:MAG TPA: 30S ribosome-binding factor RbfA [Chloroflexota bacterium]|nr:30S ribosome-binding factor RbfA [Chloroflexota bacterium]